MLKYIDIVHALFFRYNVSNKEIDGKKMQNLMIKTNNDCVLLNLAYLLKESTLIWHYCKIIKIRDGVILQFCGFPHPQLIINEVFY